MFRSCRRPHRPNSVGRLASASSQAHVVPGAQCMTERPAAGTRSFRRDAEPAGPLQWRLTSSIVSFR